MTVNTKHPDFFSKLSQRIPFVKSRVFLALILFVLGTTLPLSFAPFDYWPTALVSIALFQLWIDKTTSNKQAFILGWSFGFGVFASGASWVYVSIHEYGYAPVPLAVVMTGLFTWLLGLFFAFQTYSYKRWFSTNTTLGLLSFPIIWVLFEWIRSWFLTGFPWLYLGYGHIDSWLSGWAPIFGVFGVSLVVALTASAFKGLLSKQCCGWKITPICLIFLLWPLGMLLSQIQWTEKGESLSVTLMQGNIPQEKKWTREYRPVSLSTYRQLTRNANSDLIIWPETAVPYFKHHVTDWLDASEQLLKPKQGLITGIPYYDQSSPTDAPILHNTVIGLGNATGEYHKQKLVPFGEYVPMQNILRGLIQFFNLPMSNFRPGPQEQFPLEFKGLHLWPAICYEIAYPAFIANNIVKDNHEVDVIITISNDAWFGDSIGPKQHLQIAQMRALENSRYVLRSTNTGLTAVIDPQGQITDALPDFIAGGLNATITAQTGTTPYSRWANLPILVFIMLALSLIIISPRILSRLSSTN